ncbi:MAG: TonB-dependent receptor [Salinivirgaceae bacterium]
MRKSYILMLLAVWLMPFTSFSQDETVKDTVDAPQLIELPTLSLTSSELEEGEAEGDNISGLLFSSRDVYVSLAGFQFGPARYRVRGYGSEWTSVMLNGIPMNDMETGSAYWSTWGGLNDVTRSQVHVNGVGFSDYGFGNIGGLTHISTRASEYYKGSRLTYSMTNRNYRNRLMATHSTGMMENGWAFTFSASRRWAQEGYVEGTFYDAYSYFMAVEKKINATHSLNLTAFGAPRKYGKSAPGTQEVYDLVGSNFYNPNWGYQNGEKRNARVGDVHQPVVSLTHYWDINDKSKLTTTAAYQFGKYAGTSLSWFGGNDPRPDYYRYLPSFYTLDAAQAEKYTQLWQTDEDFRQLDWDNYYQANRNNLYTVYDVDGIAGNDVQGNRSNYIVEEIRNDQRTFSFSTVYKQQLNDQLEFNGGLNAKLFKGLHYKIINDLLGGDFWYDVDKFASRDFAAPDAAQADLRNPNRIVKEGDKFGYDYVSNVNKVAAFGQVNYKANHFEYFAGLELSHTAFWRTGNMQTGLFPDNSYGDSEVLSFTNYALKGGVTYKPTGRIYLVANAAYLTQAPTFRDAFVAPRTRDQVVENIESQKVFSGDASAIFRFPNVSARLSGFYSKFTDQTWVRGLYFDEENVFGNFIMTGVDKVKYGTEFGLEATLLQSFVVTAAGGIGNYYFSNRPTMNIFQDNKAASLEGYNDLTVYLENYKEGGFPQTAASLGLKYNSPNYWYIGANVNYYADIYVDFYPYRRTANAVENFLPSDPQWGQVLGQEKLNNSFTLDFYGGKSWKINQYYIGLNANVNNALNNTDFSFGGFEQFRYDEADLEKFDNKYFYMYGTQFFLNLYVRF